MPSQMEESSDSILDLLAFDGRHVALVATALLLLLDRRNDPPGRAPGADDVLVGHGEKVPFLDGKFVSVNGADDLLP
ncbi:UNVERIFIED_CONTAM: hypothetical protein Sangu_0227700 [Sesamum angustifolium]|uniref:Uncharacterized protein n=1 Tax=Sesamum angustifolium TaxID=2727405 RepID=A0AAW2RNF7_9LAMI